MCVGEACTARRVGERQVEKANNKGWLRGEGGVVRGPGGQRVSWREGKGRGGVLAGVWGRGGRGGSSAVDAVYSNGRPGTSRSGHVTGMCSIKSDGESEG